MEPSQDYIDSTTMVYHYGSTNGSCGYCDVKIGNKAFMILCGIDGSDTPLGITPGDYKRLIDRGWRRSGHIVYKPDVAGSCCQEYTIRLDATKLKPTRDQRQALHRWNKYILGDKYIAEAAIKHPISKEEKKRKRTEFDLLDCVHEPEYENVKKPPEPEHKLVVTLEKCDYTEEKFALFKHYQKEVHGEDDSQPSGFKRFLCTNPFKPRYSVDKQGRELGAYHQCYRLDGKLVAMAVLDLLPDCVSGVYFMYHNDIGKWSPGKLSALREAALAIEKGYKYYYMGYYIHSCPKMRYKCAYGPGEVLDPEYYDWHEFDDAFRTQLDKKPYLSLTQEKKIATGEIPDPNAPKKPKEEPTDSNASNSATTQEESKTENSTEKSLFDEIDDAISGDPDLAEQADDDSDVDTLESSEEETDTTGARTVFTTKMSGALPLKQIEPVIGNLRIMVNGQVALACMLSTWQELSFREPKGYKHKLAEIVATVGLELADTIVVCLTLRP